MRLVSVIIPCYNSARFLEETLASVRAQTHREIETILVNDGTDDPGDLALLRRLGGTVTRYIEQPHRGVSAARNAAFEAATGEYVVPLDADDLIAPTYITECLKALAAHPEASFVHTDHCMFGETKYMERLGNYNLWDLLHRNMLTCTALIASRVWKQAGGYDESMTLGYADWDFWLRLAEHGCFGVRLRKVLFHYRRREGSLFSMAQTRHHALVEQIQAKHPELYSPDGLARVKARWAPAACLVTAETDLKQTIADLETVPPADPHQLRSISRAQAFLIPAPTQKLYPHSAELCALAVWAGQDTVPLPDGSLAVSRRSLPKMGGVMKVPVSKVRVRHRARHFDDRPPFSRSPFSRIHRHLVNAELLSIDSWVKHPLRSATRMIPLRVKEFINRIHPVFDLSFYLKIQPQSLVMASQLVAPLRYYPRSASGRRRLALFTPHLGLGGAEKILLDIVESLDRAHFEIFLIATQSGDSRWREKWKRTVDHIYDLGSLVPGERMAGAIYSLATNWKFETLLIQNSLSAYAAIGNIRRDHPLVTVMDIVHAVAGEGDFIPATKSVDGHIDLRIAISEAGRKRLLDAGTAEERIRLIRNGIDLEYFQPAPPRRADHPRVVLFAARLDSVKRPTMLVNIALELNQLRPTRDVRFLVAGDGPEGSRLRNHVRRANLQAQFDLVGTVSDIRPLLTQSDLVLLPSRSEGIPLTVLEAFALQRPVVCSRVGALDEVVNDDTGILVKTGPGEVERFARAIESLLNDPARRHHMGEAGRRLVEREYDQARSRRQYQELFARRAAVQAAHSSV